MISARQYLAFKRKAAARVIANHQNKVRISHRPALVPPAKKNQ